MNWLSRRCAFSCRLQLLYRESREERRELCRKRTHGAPSRVHLPRRSRVVDYVNERCIGAVTLGKKKGGKKISESDRVYAFGTFL